VQNLCNAFDPSAFLDGVVNHCKRRANPNPKPTPDPTPTPTPTPTPNPYPYPSPYPYPYPYPYPQPGRPLQDEWRGLRALLSRGDVMSRPAARCGTPTPNPYP